MSKLDRELDSDSEFTGEADNAGEVVDSEALGARHRRRFGYSAEGAQENDEDIAAKGRKPGSITKHRSPVPESRMHAFHHGRAMATAHITSVKPHKI